ncbi:MAG: alpha/beta fold hydrolase [Candidatus Pelagadaptatus aseana]|uniref:alpha/beta fold hydrolase n=1 Tax=Candidatus Pelagadaptatus aseana TaxID=3120508 RepID=UPI0039B2A995
MKKTTLVFVVLMVAVVVGQRLLPLPYAQAAYANTVRFEASLYGFESGSAQIPEMTIHYLHNFSSGKSADEYRQDSRPVLLMLHGYSADKFVWPRFARYFSDDYRIIIPDMAGHGETGYQPDWNYSGPAQADRMKALLDQLGIEQVHVIGNSMGGFIGAHMASRHPQVIASASLLAPGGVTSPQPSAMEIMRQQGRNPFVLSTREEFDEFFAMTMSKQPYLPELMLRAMHANYESRKNDLADINAGFRKKDPLEDLLSDIQPPVMLFWGAEDQLLHVSSVEVWQQALPDVKVKVWDDIGHMPMVEIPQESAEAVQRFLLQL